MLGRQCVIERFIRRVRRRRQKKMDSEKKKKKGRGREIKKTDSI